VHEERVGAGKVVHGEVATAALTGEGTGLSGTIQAVGTDGVTVSGRCFSVDSTTQITLDAAPATLADLKVGQEALVCFVPRGGDLPPHASSISADMHTLPFAIAVGAVNSIAADGSSLQVGSTTIEVDANTTYGGVGGPKSLADFRVGDLVVAKAQKQSDGSLLTLTVIRYDLVGAIAGIAAPDLTVAGRTVVTDSNTVFAQDGAPISFGDLHLGDIVGIDGSLQTDGSMLATSVTDWGP
jgi:uncharacterized protein DUF5666